MSFSSFRWRSINVWMIGLILLFGTVYYATLLRTVGYTGDTAKFQFLGHVPGVGHEPGSPTYLMALRAFDLLVPFGTPALRADLLSAVFALLTLVMVVLILQRLGVSRELAAAGAALIGCTPAFWSQAVIAEVYTLHTLFLALIVWSFLRWRQDGSLFPFVAGCAATAISFGNHLLTVTVVPALAYLVYMTDRRTFFDPRRVGIALACIILGAAQYLLLFIRTADPATAYVEMAPTDLSSFLYYISGGQFSGQWYPVSFHWFVFSRLPMVAGLFWYELGLFLIPAFAGILVIRDVIARTFLLLIAFGCVAFAAGYVIQDVFIYFLPVYVVAAIGYGSFGSWLTQRSGGRWRIPATALILVLPLIWGARTWPWVDQSRSVMMERHARAAIEFVDSNAVLVTPDYDYAAVLWYLTIGEGQQDRGISVLHLHNAADFESSPHEYATRLARYVLEAEPLWLPVERRWVPAGHDVYLFMPYMKPLPPRPSRSLARINPELNFHLNTQVRRAEWEQTISARGLRLISVTEDLQRIVPIAP